jgi:serine/threonine protein kinase
MSRSLCLLDLCMRSCLEHPNLVRLYGVAMSPIRLVLEFVGGSDLYMRLHKCPSDLSLSSSSSGDYCLPAESFPWDTRLRVALDIAAGMAHLEALNPPIIHRYVVVACVCTQTVMAVRMY